MDAEVDCVASDDMMERPGAPHADDDDDGVGAGAVPLRLVDATDGDGVAAVVPRAHTDVTGNADDDDGSAVDLVTVATLAAGVVTTALGRLESA